LLKLNEWSADHWPEEVRVQADEFADQLRANAFAPPVVHFVEWADLWSMFDQFRSWLTPEDGPAPYAVHGDRHEIYAYRLPDEGRLAWHLDLAAPQQIAETRVLMARLREAIAAWDLMVHRAAIVVLRQATGGSALDEEVTASLLKVPEWLA
jgi:hypothetical protein